MDGLHQRDDRGNRIRPEIEINHSSFFYNFVCLMNGRDINAGNLSQLPDGRLPGKPLFFAGPDGGGNFRDNFLAFADDKSIKKVNQGRRIKTAGASRNDQRITFTAVNSPERHAAQIQHG